MSLLHTVVGLGRSVSSVPTVIFLTTASAKPWVVPQDWNASYNSIELLGAGGSGGGGLSGSGGGGGAGGGYFFIQNAFFTPSQSVSYNIGLGGARVNTNTSGNSGGDTWLLNSTSLIAYGGGGGPLYAAPPLSQALAVGGNGGFADTSLFPGNSISKFGGFGGAPANVNKGAGGGGAAGPSGSQGQDGFSSVDPTFACQGGGGDQGNVSIGGTGANIFGGAGGALGKNGNAGTEWTASYGAGGGGGGGSGGTAGGNGGLYGAGGGGAGSTGFSGSGSNGLIVITYYPYIN